jgi:hypothetical protein
LALWMMERHGMRLSLLVGFASQVVMIVLTVTGVHLAEPHVAYGVVWVGQARGARVGGSERTRFAGPCGAFLTVLTVCVCACVPQVIGSFGQPLFLNNVARIAGDWFPINERDMAVTVSVVARSVRACCSLTPLPPLPTSAHAPTLSHLLRSA